MTTPDQLPPAADVATEHEQHDRGCGLDWPPKDDHCLPYLQAKRILDLEAQLAAITDRGRQTFGVARADRSQPEAPARGLFQHLAFQRGGMLHSLPHPGGGEVVRAGSRRTSLCGVSTGLWSWAVSDSGRRCEVCRGLEREKSALEAPARELVPGWWAVSDGSPVAHRLVRVGTISGAPVSDSLCGRVWADWRHDHEGSVHCGACLELDPPSVCSCEYEPIWVDDDQGHRVVGRALVKPCPSHTPPGHSG